jgi:hypothetical protein
MATGKRAFSDDIVDKAEDYHGTAIYQSGTPGPKSFNVHFTFDEAIKLSLAVQACALGLNRRNRARGTSGIKLGMSLSFKLENKSVAVIEVPLKD